MNSSELFEMLLANSVCRTELKKNRDDFTRKHRLEQDAISFLNQLDLEELETQATALINKRYSETLSHIPNTARANGDLKQEFAQFAVDYWPNGHKRHRLDAIQFLCHLKRKKLVVDMFEFYWNQFQLKQKSISVKLYRAINGKRRILLMRRKGSLCRYYWRNLPL
ncbi:MAG: hypothetical protein CMM03_10550 [Rhodopirellula sp.]|nr:hypothetical protein [Rhodopirellula sp.]|tara:strand:+ start:479 stop:976 length:498 start_codon:yes stop_codon:yes gene_type:complete